MNQTITKKELILLGYSNYFASEILRKAKTSLVEQGYTFYKSKKVNRVPINAIEGVLGYSLHDEAI